MFTVGPPAQDWIVSTQGANARGERFVLLVTNLDFDFSEHEVRVFLSGRTTFSPESIEILIDVARRRIYSSEDMRCWTHLRPHAAWPVASPSTQGPLATP
jgi:hypothetical protein